MEKITLKKQDITKLIQILKEQDEVEEPNDEIYIDSEEVLKQLPNSPFIKKVSGYFPLMPEFLRDNNKKINTIFEPGFSTKKRGWGLGLTLVKRIVKDYHKGKVFVLESQVDVGTTFRISIPL